MNLQVGFRIRAQGFGIWVSGLLPNSLVSFCLARLEVFELRVRGLGLFLFI